MGELLRKYLHPIFSILENGNFFGYIRIGHFTGRPELRVPTLLQTNFQLQKETEEARIAGFCGIFRHASLLLSRFHTFEVSDFRTYFSRISI